MNQRKKYARRYGWAAAAAMLIATSAISPAFAGEDGRTGSTEASISFTAGTLKLVSVPVLDFGTQNVSAVEETYEADQVSSAVQVSDLRGNGKGWELMVSLSEFTQDNGAAPTLKAASIEVSKPTVSAVNGNIGTPPSAKTDLVLTSDNTQTQVWSADVNEGMGVWDLNWDAADTKLRVKPGTSQEGKSVATLTWTLQTTP